MDTHETRAKAPSRFLLLAEGRALYELGLLPFALPFLSQAPHGDGHAVLVLPGFLADDSSTAPLRTYLKSLGYAPYKWALGRNLGLRKNLIEQMLVRLQRVYWESGRKVTLIGWSLGGIYARELARQAPGQVRAVISLGSPFTNDPKANHAWKLFELLSGVNLDDMDPAERGFNSTPLPVPSTSIFSRSDGITSWRCCLQRETATSESIEILEGSHMGLGHNPLALYAIADRLAQPEGTFRKFARVGAMKLLYPDPHRRGGWGSFLGEPLRIPAVR
ncbi:MAG: alpha/beta hydrolase [Acidobacteria bacterium]|nr:alpha/beta hydrolase [Acidobacteriota bacterium]